MRTADLFAKLHENVLAIKTLGMNILFCDSYANVFQAYGQKSG